ncbi:MAG: AAA family ATPase [Deltaproteobacteria bacterium]|nr:AAA family ATPase [Deltaproteobacteria bacterium]
MRKSHKTLLLWMILILCFYALFQVFSESPGRSADFSTLLDRISADEVRSLTIEIGPHTATFRAELESGERVTSVGVLTGEVLQKLDDHGVPFRVTKGSDWSGLYTLGPMLFLAVIFIFFMRQLSRKTVTDDLKKAPIERIDESAPVVRFQDVAGCKGPKAELAELASHLRDPERLERAGVGLPKGVLIEGPTGTGKSRLARAFARETGRPTLYIHGSQFLDMFVGTGAARVRDLFDKAKQAAPSIIFIDDLDSFARRRGDAAGFQGGEREHALNQLLACLDQASADQNRVLLLATTNRADLLDEAVLRSGHIDRRIRVELPDESERLELARAFARSDPAIDLDALAKNSAGASGADLESILNDARLRASGRKLEVTDVTAALDQWKARHEPVTKSS